jgi:hypothetical protein
MFKQKSTASIDTCPNHPHTVFAPANAKAAFKSSNIQHSLPAVWSSLANCSRRQAPYIKVFYLGKMRG